MSGRGGVSVGGNVNGNIELLDSGETDGAAVVVVVVVVEKFSGIGSGDSLGWDVFMTGLKQAASITFWMVELYLKWEIERCLDCMIIERMQIRKTFRKLIWIIYV